MKSFALAGVILFMVALHQDFWLWTNKSLVFGFLPIGLAYHVGYSILAALVMLTLVRTAWPRNLEEMDKHSDDPKRDEVKS